MLCFVWGDFGVGEISGGVFGLSFQWCGLLFAFAFVAVVVCMFVLRLFVFVCFVFRRFLWFVDLWWFARYRGMIFSVLG